jgi:hypothetical protein
MMCTVTRQSFSCRPVLLILRGCGHLQNAQLLTSNMFPNDCVMFEDHVGYHFLKVQYLFCSGIALIVCR